MTMQLNQRVLCVGVVGMEGCWSLLSGVNRHNKSYH